MALSLVNPTLKELFFKAQRAKDAGCNIFFDFSDFPESAHRLTLHNTLLAGKLAKLRVLNTFDLSYIEARANSFGLEEVPDHFYAAEGCLNLEIFEKILELYPETEMPILAVPANAIQAIRNGRGDSWQVNQLEREQATKFFQYSDLGKLKSEIRLQEQKFPDLTSPIYKVKLEGKWMIIVPIDAYHSEMNQHVEAHHLIKFENPEASLEDRSEYLSCSLGQAVKTILHLLEDDLNKIPEALMHINGGCWSSIVDEGTSTKRFSGEYSMYEILDQEWHLKSELAIPVSYVGFDLRKQNSLERGFLISQDANEFNSVDEKTCFIEAKQEWKAIHEELLEYFFKVMYREYMIVGNRDFKLNIAALAELMSKYLANHSEILEDEDKYIQVVLSSQIPSGLELYLRSLAYVHKANDARARFYSSKLNKHHLQSIYYLKKSFTVFQKTKSNLFERFEKKVREIMAQDSFSEGTIMAELFDEVL